MHRIKRDIWKMAIVLIGLLCFMVFTIWIPMSMADASNSISELPSPTPTVQATSTVDLTVTVLAKEKLQADVTQEQHTFDNWFWTNGVPLLTVLVIVGGGLIGYLQWLTDQRNERLKAREAYEGERETEERRAEIERYLTEDNQREAALQAYIDKMSELLLVENLRESQPKNEVRTIARVRTLTVLTQFDGRRKGNVLQFLSEAHLISKDNPIINLSGADLSSVALEGADIREGDLSRTNLDRADLSEVNLNKAVFIESTLKDAKLVGANLKEANLTMADFFRADLKKAYLIGANIEDAFLEGTDLRGVEGLTKEQLEACEAKGAIIDKAPTPRPLQPPVSPTPPSQSNTTQTPSASPVQENPPPHRDHSSDTSSIRLRVVKKSNYGSANWA